MLVLCFIHDAGRLDVYPQILHGYIFVLRITHFCWLIYYHHHHYHHQPHQPHCHQVRLQVLQVQVNIP